MNACGVSLSPSANLRHATTLALWLALGTLLGTHQALAMDATQAAEATAAIESAADPEAEQEADARWGTRETPARTTQGFLQAISDGRHEDAATFLDLRYLRGEAAQIEGPELARRFAVIVQRGTWIDLQAPADHPDGESDDGLPPYRDAFGTLKHQGDSVRLFLQRVPGEAGARPWKISNASVAMIPELYAIYGYPRAIEALRAQLPNVTLFGYELFKWVSALGLGLLAYLVVLVMQQVVMRVPPVSHLQASAQKRVTSFLLGPLGLWIVVLVLNFVAASLGRTLSADTFHRYSPIIILATLWLLFAIIALSRDLLTSYLTLRGREGTSVLLGPAATVLKLIAVIICALAYMNQMGVNVTAVLAGLGVGGIAVALALQRPLEDTLGAITLYAQQPMRIGDFCRIGDTLGTVEAVHLRATYVRTLADSLIAIPNSKVVSEPIDNITARQAILFKQLLYLRHDTDSDQMRAVLEGVDALLEAAPEVLERSRRVRFTGYGKGMLNVEAFAYIDTREWAEFLRISEALNLQILGVINSAGAHLALPEGRYDAEAG